MNRAQTLIALTVACAAVPANAAARRGDGGTGFPGTPAVDGARCADGAQWSCRGGQVLTLTGQGLAAVRSVVFLGGRGRGDDRRVKPQSTADSRVVVVVPADARSGLLRARDGVHTETARRRLRIVEAPASPPAAAGMAGTVSDDGTFPIRGPHDMGQGPQNRFGGARNHGGQDLFAKCGTPLVAVRSGTVQMVRFQARAGNYVVLQAPDGQSYAYMHMQSPSPLAIGDPVSAGEPVGRVGDTGRASGCHLHFEQWTAPGWYTGGTAIDPLPQLRRWEAAPHPH